MVFALLPDNKKATYVGMFREIFKAVPERKIKIIPIDFKSAVVSPIKKVFP